MVIFLIILLILLAVGGLPSTGLHNLGYTPSGVVLVIVIILVVLLLTGRL